MGLIIDEIWKADTIVVLLLVGIGLYCLLSKGNMIKMIIGIEIMSKGVMLNFVMSGYLQNNTGLAQALVITVIVIDVVIVALALSLIVNAYKHYGTLRINSLTRLRG